jgi:molybdate transport system regulatory protein
MPEVKIENRIWIEKNGFPFIGNGRVTLLEYIQETGSMSKAAKKLGMSYKKAWELVKSMNNQANEPLVVKETGGKNGGGTQLTLAGHSVVKEFRELEKKSKKYLAEQFENCCIN